MAVTGVLETKDILPQTALNAFLSNLEHDLKSLETKNGTTASLLSSLEHLEEIFSIFEQLSLNQLGPISLAWDNDYQNASLKKLAALLNILNIEFDDSTPPTEILDKLNVLLTPAFIELEKRAKTLKEAQENINASVEKILNEDKSTPALQQKKQEIQAIYDQINDLKENYRIKTGTKGLIEEIEELEQKIVKLKEEARDTITIGNTTAAKDLQDNNQKIIDSIEKIQNRRIEFLHKLDPEVGYVIKKERLEKEFKQLEAAAKQEKPKWWQLFKSDFYYKLIKQAAKNTIASIKTVSDQNKTEYTTINSTTTPSVVKNTWQLEEELAQAKQQRDANIPGLISWKSTRLAYNQAIVDIERIEKQIHDRKKDILGKSTLSVLINKIDSSWVTAAATEIKKAIPAVPNPAAQSPVSDPNQILDLDTLDQLSIESLLKITQTNSPDVNQLRAIIEFFATKQDTSKALLQKKLSRLYTDILGSNNLSPFALALTQQVIANLPPQDLFSQEFLLQHPDLLEELTKVTTKEPELILPSRSPSPIPVQSSSSAHSVHQQEIPNLEDLESLLGINSLKEVDVHDDEALSRTKKIIEFYANSSAHTQFLQNKLDRLYTQILTTALPLPALNYAKKVIDGFDFSKLFSNAFLAKYNDPTDALDKLRANLYALRLSSSPFNLVNLREAITLIFKNPHADNLQRLGNWINGLAKELRLDNIQPEIVENFSDGEESEDEEVQEVFAWIKKLQPPTDHLPAMTKIYEKIYTQLNNDEPLTELTLSFKNRKGSSEKLLSSKEFFEKNLAANATQSLGKIQQQIDFLQLDSYDDNPAALRKDRIMVKGNLTLHILNVELHGTHEEREQLQSALTALNQDCQENPGKYSPGINSVMQHFFPENLNWISAPTSKPVTPRKQSPHKPSPQSSPFRLGNFGKKAFKASNTLRKTLFPPSPTKKPMPSQKN